MTLSIDMVQESYPKTGLAVDGPNARTRESFRESGAGIYAEIGVYEGDTTLAIAEELAGQGEIHLFDFADKVQPVARRLKRAGHDNVVCHPNSRKIMDSYNWSLMALLREHGEPLFEYVFLDGAHTWAADALAFMLIDRLLKPGGWIEFDDYHWTIENSPSMNARAFPSVARLYTDEQMREPQVKLVVDLLVRPDRRYKEVEENRVFRKREQRKR
jgi:predicted O-methyltransferase YrrM